MFTIGGELPLVIVIIALATQAVGGAFTSVHDMEALAHQEFQLLNTLADYIRKQEARLSILNSKLTQLTAVRPLGQDIQTLISDPIKAYSLVRRLTREWPVILNFMVNDFGIEERLSRLPKEEDMESAVRGLSRLQDVYTIDTAQLARDYGGLTALDCFEVGQYLLKEKNYVVAKSWFIEALEKVGNTDTTVQQDKVLTHLFLCTIYSDCRNGTRSGSASIVLQQLMSQYPNYTLDREAAPLFTQALSGNCSVPEVPQVVAEPDEYYKRVYSETCKGIDIYLSSELRCFYVHHNNPRLLIAPFKLEEFHLNPPVLVFHDVISDQEIKEMKTAFGNVRTKCMVLKEGHVEETTYYRTCDVGWVEDNVTETSPRLTRRVGDMTNLDMEHSEVHQVASYGLGGEFLLHYDPLPSKNLTSSDEGSRLATLMFYLNDVESGGYTTFPLVGLAVKPLKGSAVFWFNIDHNSEVLDDMYHGGCPVLRGSKWVLNKWIGESGQKSEMFCPAEGVFPKQRYYLNANK